MSISVIMGGVRVRVREDDLINFLWGPYREYITHYVPRQFLTDALYRNLIWGFKSADKKNICIVSYDLFDNVIITREGGRRSVLNLVLSEKDIAVSDAVFMGRAHNCSEVNEPVTIDIVRLDVDDENTKPMTDAAYTLRRFGIDARFMITGNRGYHVLFTMPLIKDYLPNGDTDLHLPTADMRPIIYSGLAKIIGVNVDTHAMDTKRKMRMPYVEHGKTNKWSYFVDPFDVTYDANSQPKYTPINPDAFTWPKPIPDYIFNEFIKTYWSAKTLRTAINHVNGDNKTRGDWGAKGLEIMRCLLQNCPSLNNDCRARFSHVWGCLCAMSNVSLDDCVNEFLSHITCEGSNCNAYVYNIRYHYNKCAKAGKPLFSVSKALSSNGAWYSITECIANCKETCVKHEIY
jgi:hypothetical protein|nr:MAG: hypothetical protein TU36_02290 [Vulcanisaeta sp. AZ3]